MRLIEFCLNFFFFFFYFCFLFVLFFCFYFSFLLFFYSFIYLFFFWRELFSLFFWGGRVKGLINVFFFFSEVVLQNVFCAMNRSLSLFLFFVLFCFV